jgi:hypothetical protein
VPAEWPPVNASGCTPPGPISTSWCQCYKNVYSSYSRALNQNKLNKQGVLIFVSKARVYPIRSPYGAIFKTRANLSAPALCRLFPSLTYNNYDKMTRQKILAYLLLRRDDDGEEESCFTSVSSRASYLWARPGAYLRVEGASLG